MFEVVHVWELTQETIHLPLGCLQDGVELKRSEEFLGAAHMHVTTAAFPDEDVKGAVPWHTPPF